MKVYEGIRIMEGCYMDIAAVGQTAAQLEFPF